MSAALQSHLDPTDLTLLLRREDRPIRYPIGLRWMDRWHGWRDGSPALADPRAVSTRALAPTSTAYLRGLAAARQGSLAHEQLTFDATLATRRQQLLAQTAELDYARAEVDAATTALHGIPPLRNEELQARRGTETHDGTGDDIVAARRRREHHTSSIAPAQQRLDRAHAKVTALQAATSDLAASLTALEHVLADRQLRIEEHYTRRSEVYSRGYLQRATRHRRGAAILPLNTTHQE